MKNKQKINRVIASNENYRALKKHIGVMRSSLMWSGGEVTALAKVGWSGKTFLKR